MSVVIMVTGLSMYLYRSIRVLRQKSFKSMPRNLAYFVEMTELNRSLAVTRSALGVYVTGVNYVVTPYSPADAV